MTRGRSNTRSPDRVGVSGAVGPGAGAITMTAGELYKLGRLNEAIETQIKEVKASPSDQAKRLFLFELLFFAGELDRARRQIEAITYDDPALQMAVSSYRKAIDSEAARRRLF